MDAQTLTRLSLAIPILWIAVSLITSLAVAIIRRKWTASQQYWVDNARWVLIPYIALLSGHLSPRLMGLTEFNWLSSISIGAGFITVVAILLTLVLNNGTDLLQANQIPHGGQTQPDSSLGTTQQGKTAAQLIVSGAAQQFHWAFLRSALWETLLRIGFTSPAAVNLGIWVGSLIAALELLLHKRNTVQRLVDLTTLLLTTILFFYTRNLWLCWVLHIMVSFLLKPQVTAAVNR